MPSRRRQFHPIRRCRFAQTAFVTGRWLPFNAIENRIEGVDRQILRQRLLNGAIGRRRIEKQGQIALRRVELLLQRSISLPIDLRLVRDRAKSCSYSRRLSNTLLKMGSESIERKKNHRLKYCFLCFLLSWKLHHLTIHKAYIRVDHVG